MPRSGWVCNGRSLRVEDERAIFRKRAKEGRRKDTALKSEHAIEKNILNSIQSHESRHKFRASSTVTVKAHIAPRDIVTARQSLSMC